jgi:hypothetical protein
MLCTVEKDFRKILFQIVHQNISSLSPQTSSYHSLERIAKHYPHAKKKKGIKTFIKLLNLRLPHQLSKIEKVIEHNALNICIAGRHK